MTRSGLKAASHGLEPTRPPISGHLSMVRGSSRSIRRTTGRWRRVSAATCSRGERVHRSVSASRISRQSSGDVPLDARRRFQPTHQVGLIDSSRESVVTGRLLRRDRAARHDVIAGGRGVGRRIAEARW